MPAVRFNFLPVQKQKPNSDHEVMWLKSVCMFVWFAPRIMDESQKKSVVLQSPNTCLYTRIQLWVVIIEENEDIKPLSYISGSICTILSWCLVRMIAKIRITTKYLFQGVLLILHLEFWISVLTNTDNTVCLQCVSRQHRKAREGC